jgi:surface protein
MHHTITKRSLNLLTTLFFILTLFTFTTSSTEANFTATDFITTWDTENTGTSASNQITIPGTGSGYSYSIYWESLSSSTATGTIATSTSASQTITFPEPGEYKVAIKGTYPLIYFNNGGDKLKILTVEQWGSPAWTSMANAFYGCANLTVPATDAPDLSGVTIMDSMFQGASSFNQSINHWDVSNVTTLYRTFRDASSFNQPLNNWNTASVTSMFETFAGATSFNQPINYWDVSNVTITFAMFYGASSFNQSLNSWDVSKITTMHAMFERATNFNQPLNNWNTASVTAMSRMFYGGGGSLPPNKFNQDISMWDTSNVTSMESMFRNSEFNQPLNSWNVSKVTNFSEMFFGPSAFNQSLNNWNTASATIMYWMFVNNTSFNQPLSNWNTSRVTTMSGMFSGATIFDQNLSTWNVSSLATSSSGHLNGAKDMFLDAGLSQANLDSTLTSWAAQSLNSNVPFHLGLKTYSSTGQTALDTLRDTYNWTVTEQYQAEYQDGDDYTLSGTTIQSPINLNGTTTAVEVTPNNRCTFLSWSDNSTENPRTDTLTDNLTVTANVECHNPTTSTNVKARADRLEAMGNEAKAEALRAQYHLTPNSTLHTAIATIASLTTNPTITNNPETKAKLITVMQTLVVILEGMRGE